MTQLVLFDIDGTLIEPTKKSVRLWRQRMTKVFREVFGKELPEDFDLHMINGKLELRYFREMAEMLGVSTETFYKKFPEAALLFHTLLKVEMDAKRIRYRRIEDAATLVSHIQTTRHIRMGIVTGNIQANAWLKLRHTDFDTVFEVGAFGDDREDRGELVEEARTRAEKHFHETFTPVDTVVVGDTVHDIIAAKDAGTQSIGVTTGITDTKTDLKKAGAGLVVDSLMDESVLRLLRLKKRI